MVLKKFFIIILLSAIFINVHAQIFAPESNYSVPTNYPTDTVLGTDSVFIFYSPGYGGFPITADLSVMYYDTTELNFTWEKFNKTTFLFEPMEQVSHTMNANNSISTVNDLESGGYAVHITKGSHIDTTFVAWVFINNLWVNIEHEMSCVHTLLSGIEGGNDFYYYDWVDSVAIVLENGLDVKWTATPEGGEEDSISGSKSLYLNPPHFENTEFKVYVCDSFKYEKFDSKALYAAAVKPDFYVSKNGIVDTAIVIKDSVEAPYYIQFVDSSKNASSYEWVFYNDFDKLDYYHVDSVLGISYTQVPILPEIDFDSIIYYRPGFYDVALIVTGPVVEIEGEETQCVDILLKEDYIQVDTSSITIPLPNVFTPGGANPIFKIIDKSGFPTRSLKHFKISIYNRWGNKVYEYEDNSGDWPGWNGEKDGDRSLVEPGVYFYYITAIGWDNVVHPKRKKDRSGFIHIFYPK